MAIGLFIFLFAAAVVVVVVQRNSLFTGCLCLVIVADAFAVSLFSAFFWLVRVFSLFSFVVAGGCCCSSSDNKIVNKYN